ncbi:hypothetical protein T492DRAFT_880351 [Pavlovales sp. CCMP2436]|nr:hypothetical protein T492DRAFT_880351 [Pavlovales sp. CCMP2436]
MLGYASRAAVRAAARGGGPHTETPLKATKATTTMLLPAAAAVCALAIGPEARNKGPAAAMTERIEWRAPPFMELPEGARARPTTDESRAQLARAARTPADRGELVRGIGEEAPPGGQLLGRAEGAADGQEMREREEAIARDVAVKDRELDMLRKEAALLRKQVELERLRSQLGAAGGKRELQLQPLLEPPPQRQARRAQPQPRSPPRRARNGVAGGNGGGDGGFGGGFDGNSFAPHPGGWQGPPHHAGMGASMAPHFPHANNAGARGRGNVGSSMAPMTLPASRPSGPGLSKRTIQIPNTRVGTLIGKGGTTVAQVERMAGVSITIEKQPVPKPGSPNFVPGMAGEMVRNLHLEGREDAALAMAEQVIFQLLADQIDGRLLARGIVQPVSKPPQPGFSRAGSSSH